MLDYFWVIPMPVLVTLIITFFFGNKLGLKSAWLGMAGTITSFILALCTLPSVIAGETKTVVFHWFGNINLGFMMDPLTIILLLLVSFLATLIIWYAHGYMHGESGLLRFFCEMQLFTFSMLGVVIADNILQAFIFWELMGLCSYLLIGFWFFKPSAAAAAKKAFLTTRVGDVFMLMGIMILFTQTGSFAYHDIFAAVEAGTVSQIWITLATLGIFFGVIGKSAQFPLHVWLPDAMEGPTPVSALIHAATMVKAGIYLVARLFPLFALAPATTNFMLVIGAITALGTALMALVNTDFKRILAFSTLSQLGFMVVALGSLNYVAAILHLVNHAFFKALLFMGAGSAIHGTGTNNIYEMGGVYKYQKVTALTILMATISISGIPPFSGFWSKDEILVAASHANPVVFWVMIVASFLTAFYMFRLYFVAFTGPKRADYHGHESCTSMVGPLVVLAFFAIGSGYLLKNPISIFLTGEVEHHASHFVMYLSIVVASLGVLASACVYYFKLIDAEKIKNAFKPIYNLLWNRYYIDTLYEKFCSVVIVGLANLSQFIDKYIIDGIVNLIAWVTVWICEFARIFDYKAVDGVIRGLCNGIVTFGGALRKTTTGLVQQYLGVVVMGVVVLIVLVWGGVL